MTKLLELSTKKTSPISLLPIWVHDTSRVKSHFLPIRTPWSGNQGLTSRNHTIIIIVIIIIIIIIILQEIPHVLWCIHLEILYTQF